MREHINRSTEDNVVITLVRHNYHLYALDPDTSNEQRLQRHINACLAKVVGNESNGK